MFDHSEAGPRMRLGVGIALMFAVGVAAVVVAATTRTAGAATAATTEVISGTLADGTPWRVAKPTPWNGTIILDLDGFANANPTSPSVIQSWMTEHGYAIGGTTREPVGYRFRQAVDNLLAVRDAFTARFGTPTRTITMGGSRGGFVSRIAMEMYPQIFDGSAALGRRRCGRDRDLQLAPRRAVRAEDARRSERTDPARERHEPVCRQRGDQRTRPSGDDDAGRACPPRARGRLRADAALGVGAGAGDRCGVVDRADRRGAQSDRRHRLRLREPGAGAPGHRACRRGQPALEQRRQLHRAARPLRDARSSSATSTRPPASTSGQTWRRSPTRRVSRRTRRRSPSPSSRWRTRARSAAP